MIFIINCLWIVEIALGVDIILSFAGITTMSTDGKIIAVVIIIGAEMYKGVHRYYKAQRVNDILDKSYKSCSNCIDRGDRVCDDNGYLSCACDGLDVLDN